MNLPDSGGRWRRLDDVFHAALGLTPDERVSYLSHACADDDDLRREIEQLLQADHDAGRLLDTDATSHIRADEHPVGDMAGRPFGPYRALTEIGRGGMGAVLLAERVDGQFEQRVAVKVIKRGMDSAQILDRFRTERQILASLEHPNIARLIDGGTTDDGLPYFVMEHIEGRPIDTYADEQRLSIAERLRLFLQVCDAVGYAHQRLVVHRDIKPQNILVTAGGVPKLLDFGIAKVLQEAGDQGTRTISGHQLLTPEYASPEQVDGRHTTTHTDVYSLGVVLYELLTGRSPYRPRTWSTADVCASVCRSEVERPSTAIGRPSSEAADRRRRPLTADRAVATGANSLDRVRVQLRGDLDAIVLTALRKEPERRYASVEQLAGDIRRHLAGLPVRARADSAWYRGTKFVRRHRAGVAAAVLVSAALVGGTLATAWQAREAERQARLAQEAHARAEQRFTEVRKLANALLFDYHDAVKDLPGATPVRERLVRDALDYLHGLAQEAGQDPSLQRELAMAYRKVAELQGAFAGASLGDVTGAIASLRKGLAILETLLAATPDDAGMRHDVADAALALANLLSVTEHQTEALALARRAGSLYEPLAAAATPTLDERLALAHAYDTIGTLTLESGEPDEALEMYGRQLRVLEAAPASDRPDPALRRSLSIAYQHMADAHGSFGDHQAALENHRKSLDLRVALSSEFPNNTDYRALVATAHYWEADALALLGRTRDALQAYRRSLAMTEELAAADPRGFSLNFALTRVGDMLARLGDYDEALTHYQRAHDIFTAESDADSGNLWKRAGLIEVTASMCAALAGLGRHGAAAPACTGTVRLIDQTTVEPTNAVLRAALARSLKVMADGYVTLAADRRSSVDQALTLRRAALDMYQKSVAIWSDMSARGMLTSSDDAEAAVVWEALAKTEASLGRPQR